MNQEGSLFVNGSNVVQQATQTHYLPRTFDWKTVSLILAVAGLFVAGYLTYTAYNSDALVCSVGDCKTVQNSQYAKIGGIPISIFGLGMYLTVIGLGIARWRRSEWSYVATIVAFALAFAGTLYALYLTYLEIWVINAICQWCVASAILTVGLLGAEGTGVYRHLADADPN